MTAIRVVARIRPQHKSELDRDIIVSTNALDESAVVKIPNPKNESESFAFQFSSVYDHLATQQQIFDNEISPTVKHLFNGFDVTIFAYGSTGTGKTHTMRGGKAIADRGIIPRLLSSTYRRARKIEKDCIVKTKVDISLSYYEIYIDKVYDLFEAPEKRSIAGLPLREAIGGKTVVVGLTERPCENLKDFEKLYDHANVNRSTSATKLNAASSRSHAVLAIKLTVTTESETRTSVASAIDLAGSEDNRRTENGKERMVESASINRSLFTLAKCVEAISSKSTRIPYRESKMTRILSLGQNNGLTVMILNLAPVRSYHLDTLSSLNFANRTRKIEIREVENEPIFKGCARAVPTITGKDIQRQPLRPLAHALHNSAINNKNVLDKKPIDQKAKTFSVYSDRAQLPGSAVQPVLADSTSLICPRKRPSDSVVCSALHPNTKRSPGRTSSLPERTMTKKAIEDMIERKVTDVLATRALDQPSIFLQPEISEEVQKRLDALEQKIDDRNDDRERGLTFLLMAKQHAVRGENASALRMYVLAKDFFPKNAKLDQKIEILRQKIRERKSQEDKRSGQKQLKVDQALAQPDLRDKPESIRGDDSDYEEDGGEEGESDEDFQSETEIKEPKSQSRYPQNGNLAEDDLQTPRTKQLLNIVNSTEIHRIRLLKGVGAKKAKTIVDALCAGEQEGEGAKVVHNLRQLSSLPGVGVRTVDSMRSGL